ncbi:hypothetical protein [Sutterella sp.]|uniref:hypothetical protein n=1 Tax=Sutterella sp. TaxID=1981025 RepID=UPI0026DF0153|nr:hypothetical protein [Sutterella sp.]MDO5532496.1 hypothetical protein [Sutterella sp.]
MKKTTLAITFLAAAGTLVLSGCTTVAHRDNLGNPEWSRAKNIAVLFGYRDKFLPDAAAPQTHWQFSQRDNLVIDSLLVGSAEGALINLIEGKPGEAYNGFVGYLPVSEVPADDPKLARDVWAMKLAGTVEAAVKARLPEAETRIVKTDKSSLIPGMGKGTEVAVQIRDPKLGCTYPEEGKDTACYAVIEVKGESFSKTETSAFFGQSFEAWHFEAGKTFFFFRSGNPKKIDEAELMQNAAPLFPGHVYAYMPTVQWTKSQQYPPVVIEKGRVNYFVKPAGAR